MRKQPAVTPPTADPSRMRVEVNGVRQTYLTDWTVTGAAEVTLTEAQPENAVVSFEID